MKNVFNLILIMTVTTLLTLSCQREGKQPPNTDKQAKKVRSYTQIFTPFTIHPDDIAPEGISIFRCITSNTCFDYVGEYVVLPIIDGIASLDGATLYNAAGLSMPITPGSAKVAMDMFMLEYPSTIRGYKLKGWTPLQTDAMITLQPGWDNNEVTLKENERKITKPLPCPRACDYCKVYRPRWEVEAERRGFTF